MARPTFNSLKLNMSYGQDALIFKEAQAGGPPGGMPPEMGQSPVTGNPDEMRAPESANQKQYEDDFGQLAYQFVQDRAPAMIPYMIGFEVVERNDDGSKAVGIFGYKVDDDLYYIPCFFLNNQVRGVDMILNKKTNQFIPLTETWIDYILNKHSISIGGPADDRVREGMRNPDLSFVQRPQAAIGKIAGAKEEPWTFGEAWAHIKEAMSKMASDPLYQEMLCGIGSSVKGNLAKSAESGYVRDFMEKVGGPEAMLSFLSTMHDVGFCNAALTLYKDAEAFWTENLKNASIHVDRMRKKAACKSIRIVDSTEGLHKVAQDTPKADVGEEDKALDVDENARQIVEHDFTIEDTRPDEETAKVTDDKELVDFERRFNPPDGPGKYNFMMSDGEAREGILVNTVISPSCDKEDAFVCFSDGDEIVLAEASPRSLMTTNFSEEETPAEGDVFKELYSKAIPMSDVEVGAGDSGDTVPYLFVDDKGNAAGPFGIRFVIGDGDNVRFGTSRGYSYCVKTFCDDDLAPSYGFMDWNLSDRFHDKSGRRSDKGDCDCCCGEVCSYDGFVTIGSFSGLPKKTSGGVIIPKDWKALKLKKIPSTYAEYREGESHESRMKREHEAEVEHAEFEAKYSFARASDILECMRDQGVLRIKVASDGTDYYVSVDGAKRAHGPMNYKAASIDLVSRFGFRPRRAFSTLAKAAASGEKGVRLLVGVPSLSKEAQAGLVNVAMPAPAEQIPSIDPYSGVPVYTSPYIDMTQGSFTGVPGLPPEGGMTRGINIGGEMARNMGGQEIPDEHTDSLQDGALPIDEEARRLAEEAAAAGQRHVFDQAAIGGLAKVYDTANVVDSYIPDFMDTIDRLGRILFLFYWKHEDFNQRYGSDDVVQMEDRLRNVFKQLGELTLQLKEKAVQKD